MRSWKVLIEDDIQIKLTIDSSCSNHMINADVRYMYKCESISSFISTAGVPPSCCTKKGSISPLINVLHVPTADFSLLNMSSIGDEGVTAIFTSDEVLYVNNEKVNHVLTKLNDAIYGFTIAIVIVYLVWNIILHLLLLCVAEKC